MQSDLARRLSETAPRYTSYPTAPHFHAGVTGDLVADWIADIPPGDGLSLYVHIPFCDRLCWFCACHTKHTLRYEPILDYLPLLYEEVRLVAERVTPGSVVRALHFGGGSPTMLRPDDFKTLVDTLRARFEFAPDASISVEIDPNDMDAERLDGIAQIGTTRASLGVQDFDPVVQRAINREQSFEITRDVVVGLRQRGVGSINLDLLYGLPHQTEASIASTVAQALTLEPDRIALFGYAHVPWFKKHQTMIDEASLPDGQQRLQQMLVAAERIKAAGYVPIGIDHFAKPDDSLTLAYRSGRLRRNFQGYTDDTLETLIGFGPSSVSRYRQGYAQNESAMPRYRAAVEEGRLPVAKGIMLTSDDKVRGWIIERLMCDFAFSAERVLERFGEAAKPALRDAEALADAAEGMLQRIGDRFVVPGEQRPFVRSVAARFDSYLPRQQALHSRVV